jgi:insertion element IS1 protein InsB
MDRQIREIIGVFVGDKSRESAKELWSTLPAMYRQCAVIYTDKQKAYSGVSQTPFNKGRGETHPLRQRVSKLARKTFF